MFSDTQLYGSFLPNSKLFKYHHLGWLENIAMVATRIPE